MKTLLIAISLLFMLSVQAVSITEYLEMYGVMVIENDGTLDLQKKGITSLDGIESIAQPKLIRSLKLSGNRIKNIAPSQLEIFINLEDLDVSNNQLESFPALNMPNLKTLNLNNNRIPSLSNLNFPQLTKLRIKNNPIKAVVNLNAPLLKKIKIHGAPVKTIANVEIDQTQDIEIE